MEETTCGASTSDPFEGMSPEEINAYVDRHSLGKEAAGGNEVAGGEGGGAAASGAGAEAESGDDGDGEAAQAAVAMT